MTTPMVYLKTYNLDRLRLYFFAFFAGWVAHEPPPVPLFAGRLPPPEFLVTGDLVVALGTAYHSKALLARLHGHLSAEG